jgi:hypothetical protein
MIKSIFMSAIHLLLIVSFFPVQTIGSSSNILHREQSNSEHISTYNLSTGILSNPNKKNLLVSQDTNQKGITIYGRISSSNIENNPLKNVEVILDNNLFSMSDDNGRYRFDIQQLGNAFGLPHDHHIIVARASGYRTKIIRITKELLSKLYQQVSLNECTRCAEISFTLTRTPNAGTSAFSATNSIDAADPNVGLVIDEDQDNIDDIVEDWLSQRFAPIVHHGEAETNFPARVDWFLSKTQLHQYDDACEPDKDSEVPINPADQSSLLGKSFVGDCEGAHMITSDKTRSRCKQLTYYLADLKSNDQRGEQSSPQHWITYIHSYANNRGGITIQYWRFYAHNKDTKFSLKGIIKKVVFGVQIEVPIDITPGHGGDWECAAVHLDSALMPVEVTFLGHADIDRQANNVKWNGEHPKVWVEEGGHTSRHNPTGLQSVRFVEYQTWNGGRIIWWDGTDKGTSAGLLNIGEKTKPRNKQFFVKYSGLWGSPGVWFVTSGYWGPAFNETGAQCEDRLRKAYEANRPDCPSEPQGCGRIFHKAWCDDMNGSLIKIESECYAEYKSR